MGSSPTSEVCGKGQIAFVGGSKHASWGSQAADEGHGIEPFEASRKALRSSVEKTPTPCGAFPHGGMQKTPYMPATISLQTPLNTGLSLCSAEIRR